MGTGDRGGMVSKGKKDKPERPGVAPDVMGLAEPVTFFVTRGEKRALLAKIKRYGPDRTSALLTAVGVHGRGGGGC